MNYKNTLNKIKFLLNKRLYYIHVYNEYIKTKISSYNENFHGNK